MQDIDWKRFIRDELPSLLSGKPTKPGHNSKRLTHWFEEQAGFGLREYASGRKVYVVQCPTLRGRRTITIGNANIIDKQIALDVARRCIYYSQNQTNPADERKRVRHTPMFQDYLKDYWAVMYPQWKASTQHTEDKYRRLYLATAFKEKGVDEITPQDVSNWMVNATRRGSAGAVNRAFDRLRAVFTKAEDWGYRKEGSNPCTSVKRNPRRKMERFLNEQEFRRLGQVIDESRPRRPVHAAALQLLLLTGCRKEEIVGLTWKEVKGERLYLDDSKTGARIVYLCDRAQAILAGLKRSRQSNLVFVGQYGSSISIDNYWNGIKTSADLDRLRLHDIRHSYASQAARKSLPLPTIQRLLGHAKLESTARYTHFDDTHLIEVAQKISDRIEEAYS